jgi:hypothetical protein
VSGGKGVLMAESSRAQWKLGDGKTGHVQSDMMMSAVEGALRGRS